MDGRLKKHPYGFLTLVNPPDSEELAQYYAEKYFQFEQANYRSSYSSQELAAIKLRIELRAAHAEKFRRCDKVGTLLDVGCGEGFVMAFYAEKGWDVEGLDHSAAGLENMNPDQLSNMTQGNLFELLEKKMNAGEAYDLVWLGNVLEHVIDPVGLMMLIRKIVSPSGLLVVTVPNDGSVYHERLLEMNAIPERFWITPPDHLSYFTKDSLQHTAEATGWRVGDIQGDFPIDLFLSHPGSNYVLDRKQGADAHSARLALEIIIGEAGAQNANLFYSALAGVGLGRNLTAYLTPNSHGNS